jgi:hypothetical protein
MAIDILIIDIFMQLYRSIFEPNILPIINRLQVSADPTKLLIEIK